MRQKYRLPVRRGQHVVYSLPQDWLPAQATSSAVTPLWANELSTSDLFGSDARLKKRFRQFLRRGCWGVFHVLDGEWASYAWLTVEGQPGPSHMPASPQPNSCWIFHCGTKPKFRGQGLYKRSLNLLASRAREQNPDSVVYIDTEVDNLPSRSAIVSVGFVACGIVNSWTLTMPKVKSWTFTKWLPEEQHPAIECRAA